MRAIHTIAAAVVSFLATLGVVSIVIIIALAAIIAGNWALLLGLAALKWLLT